MKGANHERPWPSRRAAGAVQRLNKALAFTPPKPKPSNPMEVYAITKNIRMSAQKMREVVRQIQGLPAGHGQGGHAPAVQRPAMAHCPAPLKNALPLIEVLANQPPATAFSSGGTSF